MIEVAITGAVGRPVEARRTKAGGMWLNFSVAARLGGDTENVEWVNIAVFGATVEQVPKDLEAGERVYLEGKAHINRYVDRHKTMRASLEVVVTRFEVLGRIGKRRSTKGHTQKPTDPKEAPIPFDDDECDLVIEEAA